MFKKIVLGLLFIIVGLIFYYSWLSDNKMRSETYLPQWLINWSNTYYNLRTAIPFMAFGFLLELYSQQKTSYKIKENKNLIFIQHLGVTAVVVSIAEGGQFLVQGRSPDIMDIYFGIMGSCIGGLAYNLCNKLIKE